MFLRNYFLLSFLASTDARLRDSFLQYMKNNQTCEEDHLGACVVLKCYQKARFGRESLISYRDQEMTTWQQKIYYILLCTWSLSTKTPKLPFLLRSLDILRHRFPRGLKTVPPLHSKMTFSSSLDLKMCLFCLSFCPLAPLLFSPVNFYFPSTIPFPSFFFYDIFVFPSPFNIFYRQTALVDWPLLPPPPSPNGEKGLFSDKCTPAYPLWAVHCVKCTAPIRKHFNVQLKR